MKNWSIPTPISRLIHTKHYFKVVYVSMNRSFSYAKDHSFVEREIERLNVKHAKEDGENEKNKKIEKNSKSSLPAEYDFRILTMMWRSLNLHAINFVNGSSSIV